MARTISVKLARLAEPLRVIKVASGMSISDFLKKQGLAFDASVRVNAEKVRKDTKLRSGDIITAVSRVSGGR